MKKRLVNKSRNSSGVRLSEFVQQHRKRIVDEWVEFARTLRPWADGLSKKDLRDHAVELLDAIAGDMKTSQSGHLQAQKSKGRETGGALSRVGKKHAIDRLDGGLTLDQLVSEYRALRASVLRLWEETQLEEEGEITRFNEAIDETLAESAAWYSSRMANTREQFLDILGHDLRNPLASIVAGATLLTRSESVDDADVGLATRILNSARRMDRMVSDLLDLTRTRLGAGIPVTPKPMDLTRVCEQVIAELEVVHPDCRLHFEAKGDLQGAWDSDRLTQVISNLVANGLQYGCEDGPVTVAAKAHGDEVVLTVHNEGPPISENALRKIFEPMVRQPAQSGDKHTSGLGLGLYIAQEVVTAHGGTIGVTSLQKEGTTFTVRLPRRPPKNGDRPNDWIARRGPAARPSRTSRARTSR